MLGIPEPDAAETRANLAFGALMRSLARPGRIETLPEPGEGSIVAALIDREARVFSTDPLLLPRIFETGATICALPEADHVFAGPLGAVEDLAGIALGSDLYPDEGATLVVCGRIGEGRRVRLTGPGIETQTEIALGGLPEGFWKFRAGVARYPMGFELFLIDGDRLVGLPRSTQVEEV